jgi:hypothetical protein
VVKNVHPVWKGEGEVFINLGTIIDPSPAVYKLRPEGFLRRRFFAVAFFMRILDTYSIFGTTTLKGHSHQV